MWAAKPFKPALTTHEESNVDSLFKWVLKVKLLQILFNTKSKKKENSNVNKKKKKIQWKQDVSVSQVSMFDTSLYFRVPSRLEVQVPHSKDQQTVDLSKTV